MLEKYAGLSDEALAALPLEELLKDTSELTGLWENRKRENGILFYEPAHAKARAFHQCTKREQLISGGNRSGKSEAVLAELVIQLTKIIPYSLQGLYPAEKLTTRPVHARIVVESFVENWEKVIKPKLQWWKWSGAGEPGGSRGHWGWIPRTSLAGGDWDKAFSEKYRTLTLADGGTLTINSYDQEVAKLAGGSYRVTMFDELPPREHYKECRMRHADAGGYLMTAMTPPTEASGIAAGWVYDELMEPGLAGHADIGAFEFHTEENRILDAEQLRWIAAGLTEEERQVRLYGKFLHLSGLIHPLFTGRNTRQWCVTCRRPVAVIGGGACPGCGRTEILPFTHVIDDFEWPRRWPVVMTMDPHPRRPCAIAWDAVDEQDQWTQVGELEASGTAQDVKDAIDQWEDRHECHPVVRLIDPNAAQNADDKREQGWTLRREFDRVGLRCSLANDNFTVGKDRVNDALWPDPLTERPRLQIFSSCEKTIFAMSRYTWDEWSRGEEFKDPKQTPRDKHKHFPDCFDGSTEILTQAGWIRFDELPEEVPVATMNLQSGRLEFQMPTDYIVYPYDGPMVEVDARGVNLLVTPNHRLLVYPQSDTLRFRPAGELKPQDRLPSSTGPEAPEQTLNTIIVGGQPVLADDWAEFMGWYLSEGCATGTRGGKIQLPGRGYSVYISQRPGPSADTIAACLDRLPWKYRYQNDAAFVISNKALWEELFPLGNSRTKYIPRILLQHLSASGKRRMWDALVGGDGWVHKGTEYYATISPRLADDVSELLTRMGSAFAITTRLPSPSVIRGRGVHGRHKQYYIAAKRCKRVAVSNSLRHPRYKTVPFEGMVYCVSVPNETLVVRRRGLSVVTGNCLRYLAMYNPTFRALHGGYEVLKARGGR